MDECAWCGAPIEYFSLLDIWFDKSDVGYCNRAPVRGTYWYRPSHTPKGSVKDDGKTRL